MSQCGWSFGVELSSEVRRPEPLSASFSTFNSAFTLVVISVSALLRLCQQPANRERESIHYFELLHNAIAGPQKA